MRGQEPSSLTAGGPISWQKRGEGGPNCEMVSSWYPRKKTGPTQDFAVVVVESCVLSVFSILILDEGKIVFRLHIFFFLRVLH